MKLFQQISAELKYEKLRSGTYWESSSHLGKALP